MRVIVGERDGEREISCRWNGKEREGERMKERGRKGEGLVRGRGEDVEE